MIPASPGSIRALFFKIAGAVLIATQASCALLNGGCDFESRDVRAAGRIDEGGALLVSADVSVHETRGGLTQGEVHGQVDGPTLKGHVLSALIKDAAGSSRTVVLTVAPASSSSLAYGGEDAKSGFDLSGFHEVLVANNGIVEIKTDIPSRPTILVPLLVTLVTGWVRPNCS